MDKLKLYANQKTQKLNSAIDDQKKIREESEEQMVQLLKEMMAKIKDQINNEQKEREMAEDALLKLLEDTCIRLNYKQQL